MGSAADSATVAVLGWVVDPTLFAVFLVLILVVADALRDLDCVLEIESLSCHDAPTFCAIRVVVNQLFEKFSVAPNSLLGKSRNREPLRDTAVFRNSKARKWNRGGWRNLALLFLSASFRLTAYANRVF